MELISRLHFQFELGYIYMSTWEDKQTISFILFHVLPQKTKPKNKKVVMIYHYYLSLIHI